MRSVFKNLVKVLSFLLIVSLYSCFEYKDVEVVEYKSAGIKSISAEKVEIEVTLRIKNPNNYKISIVDSDLELFIKGDKIGTAAIRENVVLKKNVTDDYVVTIETGISDIVSGALPVLAGLIFESAIDLQIKGDIKARAKSLSKRFPIDYKDKVKLN